MIDLPNLIGKNLLSADRATISCPPGPIIPGEGPLVLVPTIMRSGTHILIDSIINNFARYKRYPLMIGVDRFFYFPEGERDRLFERLFAAGGYVIKTHYPQVGFHQPWRAPYFERLAGLSRIVTVEREREAAFRSSRSFFESEPNARDFRVVKTREEYDEVCRLFDEFWGRHDVLRVDFKRLVDPTSFPRVIREIGDWVGAEPRPRLIPPYPKGAKARIFLTKGLTRLLGRRSPVVNTTLRFAKSE